MKTKILVLGNGIAGHSAIQTLLKEGDAEITIITKEHFRTYRRPMLPSVVAGEVLEEKFFVIPEGYYREHGIQVVMDSVLSIDLKKKLVITETNQRFGYDKLILALGSSSFIPPTKVLGDNRTELTRGNFQTLDGLFTLRELTDAKRILECLDNSSHVVVIGGGLLGLEAAWEFHRKGLQVTIIEVAERLLPRQLDSQASSLLRQNADSNGIDLILGDVADSLVYVDGKLIEIITKAGKHIPADLILFSVGVRPNIQVAKDAGLLVQRAIVVNDRLQTTDPDVFACGDCAELDGQMYAIWPFAMNSGKTAALNALGQETDLPVQTMATLYNGLGTKIFSVGNIDFNDPSLESMTEGGSPMDFKKLFFKDGSLVGAIILGDTSKSPLYQRAVMQKTKKQDLSF